MNGDEQSGFRVSVSIPKARFRQGESLPIAIYVKNVSSEDSALFFPSSQKFDINIKDANGAEVWSWAKGRVFTMALEEMTVKVGKQDAFSYIWDQKAGDGNQVAPGRYIIQVLCTSKQTPVPVSINIEITP